MGRLSWLAAVLGLGWAWAGCSRPAPLVAAASRSQTLLLGNLAEPKDLDPQSVSDTQTQNIDMALFEGLTQYDPKTAEPMAGVATRWEVSADNLTWTFHLRPEARWSNGDPLTAADFIFAFNRIKSPQLGAEYAYFFDALKSATAPDPSTLVLALNHPVPYLPAEACHPAWYPLHRATLEKFGGVDRRGSAWTRPGNLVGNGPFTLVEWKSHEVVHVRRNPRYWNAAHVRLQDVFFYPIESIDTEERAFRSGQLHATASLPPGKIATYEKDAPQFLQMSPYFATYFYRFNVTKPPFNDVRVRRALALTIDRLRIVRDVTRGHQDPAVSVTPPGVAGFTADTHLHTDVPLARQLLAAAGYPGGRGFPHVDLLFNSNEGHKQIAEAIQRMWHEELGIEVGLTNQEGTVWLSSMRELDYQVARFAWTGDYLDASSFLDIMRSTSGNNQTGWKSAEYDRLLDQANSTADPARRYACYQRCEQILAEECPITPIYYYKRISLLRPEVKGWYPNLLDFHVLTDVYLDVGAAH